MNGDIFGERHDRRPSTSSRAIPRAIRDLAVGFGSLRTVRAEAQPTGPVVDGDLRLEDGRIMGTVTNRSSRTLVAPALVLGLVRRPRSATSRPGATGAGGPRRRDQPGQPDVALGQVVGQTVNWDGIDA